MHSYRLETQQPDTHRTAAGPIFILADDLTGACDSAVAFVSLGRTVRLVLDTDGFAAIDAHPDSIIAFSTETRGLTDPRQAADRVAHIVGLLRESPTAILFKKVDSAARGHFDAETIAALDASGAALALVAPAFPAAGRTVFNGILTIRDAAAQNTSIGLRDLFPEVDNSRIDVLPTGTSAALEREIARALAVGIRILLCDAQTQADLEQLAIAASRLDQRILWAGSAGLAHAVARTILPSRNVPHFDSESGEGRTLVFVGTDHPVTVLQLAHLDVHPPLQPHAVHSIDWTHTSPQQIRATFAAAAALVLTGGETAAYVLQALHASSILLAGEVAPGVPWGVVEGGHADGCIVVTKSGGLGSRSALAEAIDFCAHAGRAHASA